MIRLFRLVFAVVALTFAGACAGQPDSIFMVPRLTGVDTARGPAPAYRDAITVGAVTGGKDTTILHPPYVSNTDLRDALVQTLIRANLARAENGRFRLDAVLQKLDQPFIALDITVTATIAYKLTEVATGTVVYDKALVTSAKATIIEHGVASERLRLANTRAVSANLQRLVEEIYALPDHGVSTSFLRSPLMR
ncbi:MAG: hypothetical protein Q8M19_02570 [Reyranella sp.]|nr:hypothetical protein [Reyranella sp.]